MKTRSSPVIVENGDQLSKLAGKGEQIDKGRNKLRGGIIESRDLLMLHSLNSRLCMSTATDTVEAATPQSYFFVTPGDANHRTKNHCGSNHYKSEKIDRCVALRCVALRCVALRCVALRCVALRCVALRCVALRCVALRCVALRCVALRCVALRCALRCVALRYVTLYTSLVQHAVFNWGTDRRVTLHCALNDRPL